MTEEWDWQLTERGRRQFDGLDDYTRERIATKLDEARGRRIPWRRLI